MRNLFLVLTCVGWVGLSCANAQPLSAPTVAPLSRPTLAPALAYEATDDRGVRHHLLGTIHARPPDQADLAPWQEALLLAAEVLVLEIDPRELEPRLEQELWMSSALLSGQVLDDLLSDELRSLLRRRLREVGLTADQVQVLRPWAVEVLIATVRTFLLGLRPEAGVDAALHRRALSRGMTIEALESRQAQLSALAAAPLEEQLRSLRRSLEEWQEDESELRALLESYRTADAARLQELLDREWRRDPGLWERLVVRRNEAMAARLAELALKGRPMVVAVGTAHLFGEHGLPALLLRRGWRVRPLSPSTSP